MYQPSLEEARRLSNNGNLINVYKEISAKSETPVSVYLKIAKPPYSFLLESAEGDDGMGRYSFIGTQPYKVIRTGQSEKLGSTDPLIHVQKELSDKIPSGFPDDQRFNGGAVGFLSYETVSYFEDLPSPPSDPLLLPESVFMMTDTFVIFDHLLNKIRVVSQAYIEDEVTIAYQKAVLKIDEIVKRIETSVIPNNTIEKNYSGHDVKFNMSKDEYERMVKVVKDYIYKGDVIQTVISQRFQRPISVDPFQIYQSLRMINPSPYMYYMDLNGFQIVGASPELLVQVENGRVATHPIAGTRPRGADTAEDIALENDLLDDEKERAEHIMLVDLGRNDIGKVSKAGTVEVTQFMDVERYSHVMHLVSHVTGSLREDYNSFDVLRACFPAGTVSGAPKIRAMEIIAELEPDKRGPYAGAVGYFDFAGNLDTAITIRTLVIKDGIAYTQAGGGIVHDSNPGTEFEETVHKASAVLRAIENAEKS